ncbi:MAG: ribonuclease P protein component [Candidatus Shapirobacteria bacterium]|jgi:ribonuclease P protein component
MLKKKNRLRKKKDFEKIKRLGEWIRTPIFGALWLKEMAEEMKFGMVVSKKVSKKATERNKIKRILARLIKNKEDCWKDQKGMVLILVRQSILNKSYDEISKEVEKVWERIAPEKR